MHGCEPLDAIALSSSSNPPSSTGNPLLRTVPRSTPTGLYAPNANSSISRTVRTGPKQECVRVVTANTLPENAEYWPVPDHVNRTLRPAGLGLNTGGAVVAGAAVVDGGAAVVVVGMTFDLVFESEIDCDCPDLESVSAVGVKLGSAVEVDSAVELCDEVGDSVVD